MRTPAKMTERKKMTEMPGGRYRPSQPRRRACDFSVWSGDSRSARSHGTFLSLDSHGIARNIGSGHSTFEIENAARGGETQRVSMSSLRKTSIFLKGQIFCRGPADKHPTSSKDLSQNRTNPTCSAVPSIFRKPLAIVSVST